MQAKVEIRLDTTDDFVVRSGRAKDSPRNEVHSVLGVSDEGDGTTVDIFTKADRETEKVAHKLIELGVKMLTTNELIKNECDAMARAREEK